MGCDFLGCSAVAIKLVFIFAQVATSLLTQAQKDRPLQDLSQHPLIPVSEQHHTIYSCQGYSFPDIACIKRYGAVLPGNFSRQVFDPANADTFASTEVPEDDSFAAIADTNFLIFDHSRAYDLLGPDPSVDYMFKLSNGSHEAPVYVPDTNEFIFSRLEHRLLSQMVVSLNDDPPTLSEKRAIPPIYTPCGAKYYRGLVYYAVLGGDEDIEGRVYRPGLYTLDPWTWKSEVLLNNYFGYYFSGLNDLDIDEYGQVWFTDDYYGRATRTNTQAPQINAATWRFDPVTSLVNLVEDSLDEPNGVRLSPDGNTLYLSDTGAGQVVIDSNVDPPPRMQFNTTGKRTVYAFDIERSGHNPRGRLVNKRPTQLAIEYATDGIQVTREGYIVSAMGQGVMVTDQEGVPLVRVQTNFTVINFAWTGRNSDELWCVGHGYVARIRFGLKGLLPVM